LGFLRRAAGKTYLPSGTALDLFYIAEFQGRGVSMFSLRNLVFMVFVTSSITLSGFALAAGSAEPTVLTFSAWRAEQVLEAQNQALRINARLNQSKASKAPTEVKGSTNTKGLPGTRLKSTSDNESISVLEHDLKRAQDSLQAAHNLELDDYINIYLPTLQDQPDALNSLAEKLNKEDLVEIFKGLVKRGTKSNDAMSHNGATLEGLKLSSHPKSF
jgi:hypothetical protein